MWKQSLLGNTFNKLVLVLCCVKMLRKYTARMQLQVGYEGKIDFPLPSSEHGILWKDHYVHLHMHNSVKLNYYFT